MNKKISKDVFVGAGIPTAAAKSYNAAAQNEADIVADIKANFTLPVVLKPATQGSSIGVTIVRDDSELTAGVKEALVYDNILVVEQYLDGHEFTVPVLEGKAYRLSKSDHIPVNMITLQNIRPALPIIWYRLRLMKH